uniref:Small nuclear RNA-activating complex polypeptide 3 n=1 Tax=Caenorhabditis japonica TaxID=281687 RepID=A0A8R1I5B6_CAEJA
MFLEGPSDICTRTLSDLKGNQGFLKTSTLYTHQSVRNRDELIQSSRHRKSAYVTSLKYDKYIVSNRDDTNLYRPQCSAKSECDNDIVLTVDALQPYNRMLHPSELRSSRLLRPMGKFLVRGDTLLFDLRQKLCCQSDTIVPLENGEELNPMNLDFCTAEKFPSAFIFIHDTFYVDSSSPHAKDISFPIRNFMQQKEIFDPVEATKMDDIRIVDLKLRLGQPYLFQHSGNCEHLLVFHDLRLLHESDPHGLEKYPFTLYEKTNDRKCEVCKKSHVE